MPQTCSGKQTVVLHAKAPHGSGAFARRRVSSDVAAQLALDGAGYILRGALGLLRLAFGLQVRAVGHLAHCSLLRFCERLENAGQARMFRKGRDPDARKDAEKIIENRARSSKPTSYLASDAWEAVLSRHLVQAVQGGGPREESSTSARERRRQ